ncbi:hypothetical protein OAS39_11725 [Pirellulales bacterium]|nr:hypothetical protein [Pirellulales bacterium]
MARVKQVGPPVLVVALVAGVIGYILGCTQQQREQGAHGQTQEPVETETSEKGVDSTTDGEAAERPEQDVSASARADAEPRGRKPVAVRYPMLARRSPFMNSTTSK